MTTTTQLSCACGKLHLAVEGAPILVAECHCDSCRAAAGRLGALPRAQPITEPNGGTHYVLYRKDRVRFTAGTEHMHAFRLTPESPTRRVVATCCNTPLFTEFQNGHWLSLFGRLWPDGERPKAAMRTMTSDLPAGTVLSNDIPNAGRQSLGFFGKLLLAWVAMGFRTPKIAVAGDLPAGRA